jgi:hypothetical protein
LRRPRPRRRRRTRLASERRGVVVTILVHPPPLPPPLAPRVFSCVNPFQTCLLCPLFLLLLLLLLWACIIASFATTAAAAAAVGLGRALHSNKKEESEKSQVKRKPASRGGSKSARLPSAAAPSPHPTPPPCRCGPLGPWAWPLCCCTAGYASLPPFD